MQQCARAFRHGGGGVVKAVSHQGLTAETVCTCDLDVGRVPSRIAEHSPVAQTITKKTAKPGEFSQWNVITPGEPSGSVFAPPWDEQSQYLAAQDAR